MKTETLLPKLRSKVMRRSAAAFTLVEMIVVITIITILLTVGALGLKNLSKGSGVSAGLPVAEAVFAEARAIAIGKGTNARVLIHANFNPNDDFHKERYLKYMIVAYEELDADGNPNGNWKLDSRGVTLPDNVYFIKDLSENNAPPLQTDTIELPGRSSSSCYYYQFNSEGLITSPEISGNSVPRFVIRVASLPPGQQDPIASSDAEKNMGGFVIWRSGRTSIFRHPDQIE
ncbi:MAG: prepilin-type N-terminal cleavage/methylation domain-containing protein [Akkermansiaceae bacterium]